MTKGVYGEAGVGRELKLTSTRCGNYATNRSVTTYGSRKKRSTAYEGDTLSLTNV